MLQENFKIVAFVSFSISFSSKYLKYNRYTYVCVHTCTCVYTPLIHIFKNYNNAICFAYELMKVWFDKTIFKFQLFLKCYKNSPKICHENVFSFLAGVFRHETWIIHNYEFRIIILTIIL